MCEYKYYGKYNLWQGIINNFKFSEIPRIIGIIVLGILSSKEVCIAIEKDMEN